MKLDIDGTSEWRHCFDADDVFLPLGYYFGISAATGDLAGINDLVSTTMFQWHLFT